MTLLAVFTTVATREDAQALAGALVESGHVACAQVSAIDSVYRWQGAVQHEPEFRVLLKTTADRYDAVEAAIRARHPYTLPAIWALPVAQAFAPYAEWVARGGADPA